MLVYVLSDSKRSCGKTKMHSILIGKMFLSLHIHSLTMSLSLLFFWKVRETKVYYIKGLL